MSNELSIDKSAVNGRIFSLEEVKQLVALVIKGAPAAVAAKEIGMSGSYALDIIKGKTDWDLPEEALRRARAKIKKRGRPAEPALNRRLDGLTVKVIREKWLTGEYGVNRLAKMYGVYHSTISDIVHCRTYLSGVDANVVEACRKVDRKGKPRKANKHIVDSVKALLAKGELVSACAKRFNVSRQTIRRIRKGDYDNG